MRAWGKNYHVMVPQGFTDAMYSLYDGQEGFDLQLVSLDYKYRESKRWLVAHPSFPEIVLGQVEIENVYGLSVENTAKVKLAGAHAALFEQNKSFAYFL